MGTFFKDLRLGVRMLFKYRELTGAAVLALSLGIGLTTIMLTIVYGTLLRGLPFEEPEQLVRLRLRSISTTEPTTATAHDFLAWRERLSSFEDLAAWYGKSLNLSDRVAGAGRYNGAYVSPHLLELLRIDPVIGRGFDPITDRQQGTVLIGHGVWLSRYGGDPRVIGETIRVDGEERLLIGVLPRGFGFPLRQEVWLPLFLDRDTWKRGQGSLQVFGRLEEGVSRDQAQADLNLVSGQLAAEHPDTHEDLRGTVEPYISTYTMPRFRAYLWLMLGAVVGVLLIACANVTNLLLARVALRTRDMAVRTALGASRARLIVQLLGETFVLAFCGGLFGLILTKIGIDLYNRMMSDHLLSFWMDVRFDLSVFLFVLGVTVIASLLSGLWPAIRASGTDANEVLKDLSGGSSSRRLGRFSRTVVVAEFALSCGLLVATGLMIKSLVNLENYRPNFATENILTAQLSLHRADYPTTASQLCFYEELKRQLQTLPGVQSVAFASHLPGKLSTRDPFLIEDCCKAGEGSSTAYWAVVSPGFFETFSVQAVQGRLFGFEDGTGSEPVALVNESFVARHFPDESPLGRRLQLQVREEGSIWRTVVGVVPDMALEGMSQDDPAGIYLPLAQRTASWMALAMRVRSDPMALSLPVRQAVSGIDRHLPLFWVKPMPKILAESSWHYSTFSTLFLIFGAAAFLLATIGLYGVVSLAAHQRIHECGLRMALGAGVDDVQRLIVRGGLAQLSLGVLFGLVLSAALCQMMTALLFQVEPWDFSVFGFVALALFATGLLACWIPAQRTAKVDPMIALRDE